MAVTENDRQFGERLQRLRDDRGWSQRKVAELLAEHGVKVTGSTVGNWERGNHPPRTGKKAQALELIFDSPGELAPLLGYESAIQRGRLDALSDEVNELRERIEVVEEQQAGAAALLAEQGRRRGSRPTGR